MTSPLAGASAPRAQARPGDGLQVAYLVSQYPALSHAFIDREIQALRQAGARIDTFSVRPPGDDLLSESMVADAAATAVLQTRERGPWLDAGRSAARVPRAVATLLNRASRTGQASVRGRTWQMFYAAEALRLWQLMSQRGLRHVHAHFANNGADIARLAVELGRAADGPDAGWQWSFTMHGPTELEEVSHFDLPGKVRSAAAVACISDYCRSQLMRYVDPQHWDKLRMIRMSTDLERFVPSDRSGRTGPLRVLDVGRLVPEKGAPVLLDAVAALTRREVAIEVRLIGDGPLRGALNEQARRLGIADRVELVGPVANELLPQHYAWADLFCLPSFAEGLPVVLMEAMACGLPVVTTRIAGIAELVSDGVNGRVLSPGRADLLGDALSSLAAHPELRARFASRARAAVEGEYRSERSAAALCEMFAAVQRDGRG